MWREGQLKEQECNKVHNLASFFIVLYGIQNSSFCIERCNQEIDDVLLKVLGDKSHLSGQ